jgi:hypothetical protein
MKRMLWAIFAALAVALLAGCAGIPPPPDEMHEVAGMLANHERLASSKTEEQRSELLAAQAAHERMPNDTTRLNLALAMLLPRTGVRDDARIQSLLSGIEATPGEQHSTRHDLAQILLRFLVERQHAQRDEQRKADQLVQHERDEQRKMDQLLQQLREERRKTEEMQQKIESLRAIDRETRMRRKEP